jgi:hypothetical protein
VDEPKQDSDVSRNRRNQRVGENIGHANADAKIVQIRYSGMHENTVPDVGDDVGTVGGKRSISG